MSALPEGAVATPAACPAVSVTRVAERATWQDGLSRLTNGDELDGDLGRL